MALDMLRNAGGRAPGYRARLQIPAGLACFLGVVTVHTHAETRSPKLVIKWSDPHRLVPVGWKRVGRQTKAIFADVGVEIEWKKINLDARLESAGEIQVLLVPSEPGDWKLEPDVMGVVLSQTEQRTTVCIFYPSVLRALGYRAHVVKHRFMDQITERNIARALSRVVAHEIIHAVIPSLPHASSGLTQCELNKNSLLQPEISIHPVSAMLFKNHVSQLIAAARTETEAPSEK